MVDCLQTQSQQHGTFGYCVILIGDHKNAISNLCFSCCFSSSEVWTFSILIILLGLCKLFFAHDIMTNRYTIFHISHDIMSIGIIFMVYSWYHDRFNEFWYWLVLWIDRHNYIAFITKSITNFGRTNSISPCCNYYNV